MKDVILAGAVRTAIGSFGGSLKDVPATALGAVVIRAALARAGVPPEAVDEVLMGCVLQAGLGQNVARQAAIQAGLPVRVPATTLNNVCGSGLKAVNMAAALIRAGEADVIVAGGMENMSAAPFALAQARFGYRMKMPHGELIDCMVKDGLWEAFHDYHMGVTAENIAAQYGLTREMQDAFAAQSQQKCEAAQAAGVFRAEIVPVPLQTKKGEVLFETDEFPRAGVTVQSLSRLKPSFLKDGTVTAGNASGINDGAAAIVVMSAEKAEALGVQPMARVRATASAGVSPEIMGTGPIAATRKALEKAGLTVADLDLIEGNEAFAAQALAVDQEMGWDLSRVNVHGGAIALGHPIGASGCRILVTLLHEMQRRGSRIGLATLCVGGGMGVATIVER